MKRFLLFLSVVLFTACSNSRLVETYTYDLTKYYNDGFMITTGDIESYEPISLVTAVSREGNVQEWSDEYGRLAPASLDSAMNAAYKSSVELGANALINVNVHISDKKITVDGLAVKR